LITLLKRGFCAVGQKLRQKTRLPSRKLQYFWQRCRIVVQPLEAALAQGVVSQSREAGLGHQGGAVGEAGAGAEAEADPMQGETEADLGKGPRGVESRVHRCRTGDGTKGIERSPNQTSVLECLDSVCTPPRGSSRRSLEDLEHSRKPRWC